MIQISNLIVSFGNKKLYELNNLNINNSIKNNVIGIVGNNGSGKTTLAKIIAGQNIEHEGNVTNTYNTHYLEQNFLVETKQNMSGGEYAKSQILKAFDLSTELLILDEPSVHLDEDNINFLIYKIQNFKGIILLISHNRELLKAVSKQILSIDNEIVRLYKMKYEVYIIEKENELKQQQLKYKEYINQKNSLKNAINFRNSNSNRIKKSPKRMGVSEQRLDKWSRQGAPSADKQKVALINKLDKLEEKNTIFNFNKKIYFEYNENYKLNKFFEIAKYNLILKPMDRIAVIGKNGSGKTTLLNSIFKREIIHISLSIRISYLTQTFSSEYNDLTVIEYISKNDYKKINIIRKYLAQFKVEEAIFNKKISDLSVGEKIQLNLSLILLNPTNLILLDEPTNYLDIQTIEMLEEAILNFKGAIIFASHDKEFIDKVASKVIKLK